MTADEAAFLARIREEPDADLPRLVFADYLEEQGHEARAQFIRAQIELASLTEDSPRRRELAWHCRPTVEATAKQWHDAPKGFAGSEKHLASPFAFARPRLIRGLIEYAEFWRESVEVVEAAFRHMPLRRVWLYDFDAEPRALELLPLDNCLRSLDLTGNFGLEGSLLRRLFESTRLPMLTELVLTGCELWDDDVAPLFDIPQAQQLRRIHLGANPLSENVRERLTRHFGERVTFEYDRDPDWLYAFDEKDSTFTVGFGHDLTQHLVQLDSPDDRIAVFDHAGNLIRLEQRPNTGHARGTGNAERAILRELGHRPAKIRVKRFQFPDGMGVTPFCPARMHELEYPGSPDDRFPYRNWLANWLDSGLFRWNWTHGNDMWLNGDGQVSDAGPAET